MKISQNRSAIDLMEKFVSRVEIYIRGSYSLSIIPVKPMLATKLNACYRIGKTWSGINVTNIQPPHFS